MQADYQVSNITDGHKKLLDKSNGDSQGNLFKIIWM